MNTEYRPNSERMTALLAILSFFSLAAFSDHWLFAGFFFLVMAFMIGTMFLVNYRKYIVTDKNLQVVGYWGGIKSEIEYDEIAKIFLHKGYAQTRSGNLEADTLVIDLTVGGTVRIDLTPIDESLEMVRLVKERAGF